MSKETDRVVRLKVTDDATTNILAVVRTMRSLATAIRQVRMLMMALHQLQQLEIIQVAALASAYRYLAIMKTAASMIGVGAAIVAIAASVGMMASGTGPIPIGQTSAGTTRSVSATGLAVVHAGEDISRGSTQGGLARGMSGISINIGQATMNTRRDIEETARDLGTLMYDSMRRYRH